MLCRIFFNSRRKVRINTDNIVHTSIPVQYTRIECTVYTLYRFLRVSTTLSTPVGRCGISTGPGPDLCPLPTLSYDNIKLI